MKGDPRDNLSLFLQAEPRMKAQRCLIKAEERLPGFYKGDEVR